MFRTSKKKNLQNGYLIIDYTFASFFIRNRLTVATVAILLW